MSREGAVETSLPAGETAVRQPGHDARLRRADLAIAVVLLATLVLTAALRVRLLPVPLERDEGEYAHVGRLIFQGIPPFAEAYTMKLPGIAACYALVMAAFGQTPAGIHVGLLLVNAASIILVYLLGRRLLGDWAGVTAAIVFAAFSLCLAVQGASANAEHFLLVPVLGGLLVLMGRSPPRAGRLFVAGLLLGLGFIIKQHAAAFIAWGGLYGVGCAWAAGNTGEPGVPGVPAVPGGRVRRVAGHAASFSAGALTPFLVTCAFYLALDATSYPGIFHRFWFWTFSYANQYVREATVLDGWEYFKLWTPFRLDSPTLPLWLLALIGLLAMARHQVHRSTAIFLSGLTVFSFIAVCPGLYFRPHYFVLTLPAIALWSGVGAGALAEALARRGARWVGTKAWAPVGLAVLGAAYTVAASRDYLFVLSPTQIGHGIFQMDPFPEAVEIGRYIREHTGPDDRVLVLGSEPEILFYAQRRSATGFMYMYPLMEPQPYAREMQEELIHEVEANRPTVVVYVRMLFSWNSRPDSDPLLEEWRRKYVAENFERVGLMDMADANHPEFFQGEESLRSPRADHGWIAIYRRREKPLIAE